jgi:hypothetical protein
VVALVVQNLGQKTRMGRKMEEQLEDTSEPAKADDSAGPDDSGPTGDSADPAAEA